MATRLAKRFALEYCRDFRARKAAVRAGASPRGAHTVASRWLQDVEVQALIEQTLQERRERNEVQVERLMREYGRLAFSMVDDVADVSEDGRVRLRDWSELEPEQLAAIRELKPTADGVQVKMHDKVRAMDSLGKILGLFRDPEVDETKKMELVHRFVPARRPAADETEDEDGDE